MINLHNLKYFKRPGGFLLFIMVFFSLMGIKVLLNLTTLPRLLKFLDPEKRVKPDDQKIEDITKFSDFILYRFFKSLNPCLLRSLLLFRHFRMMGREIKIVFGVKDEGEKLKGHAWLIVEERHFSEPNDPFAEYRITFVYP